MIDEIGFDTSNALGMINKSWEESSLDEPLSHPPPADETVTSLRSSNRRLRGSLVSIDYSSARRENECKSMPASPTPASDFHSTILESNNTEDISENLKKYFFDKMKKKGIGDAESIYDQYLMAGFSEKVAIVLTDRRVFPKPHEKDHGNYLKNVIGNELFKKEQAARQGKDDWIEKTNSTAIKTLETLALNSKTHAGKSKKREYKNNSPGLGGYLLGVVEIIAGSAIIATGTTLEVVTLGGFTIGFGVAVGSGASLIALGLATTSANAPYVYAPKVPKYDPILDIVNKPREKPRRWDEPGSPPIRGDELNAEDRGKSPGQGFNEWKGRGDPTSGNGSWSRGRDGKEETLHPDLDHPIHGPHWDYHGPGGKARIYPDGTWEPKQ